MTTSNPNLQPPSQPHTPTPPHTAWYFKLSWVLSNLSNVSAPIVTIIYFVVLYPDSKDYENQTLGVHNVNQHVMNLGVVLLDLMVTAHPVRLLHMYLTLIYGTIYIIFTVIYFLTTDYVIYSILDWRNYGLALATFAGLIVVGLPLLQFLFFGVYQFKMWLSSKNGNVDKS